MSIILELNALSWLPLHPPSIGMRFTRRIQIYALLLKPYYFIIHLLSLSKLMKMCINIMKSIWSNALSVLSGISYYYSNRWIRVTNMWGWLSSISHFTVNYSRIFILVQAAVVWVLTKKIRIRTRFVWPEMREDIKRLVYHCAYCISYNV